MDKDEDKRKNGDSGVGRSSGEESSGRSGGASNYDMTPTSRGSDELQMRRRGWERSATSDEDGGKGKGDGRGKSRKNSRKGTTSKKDEMAKLQKELDQEIRYRDTIQWSVGVLQQSVDELQKQLHAVKHGEDFGSEYKLRYETQLELNAKLEEQTAWYVDEIDKTKEKIKEAYKRIPYTLTTLCQEFTYDQDLDEYTEFELQRMVKSLERERNNYYGDLRSKSWLLDNQSKEYYHLKELIKAYSGDLTVVTRSMENMWRQRTHGQESNLGLGTPVTSPGGVKWSGQSGIRPSQRILDPRKGPVRKTVGVHSLPRLDQEALDLYDSQSMSRKARSRYRGKSTSRAKSLDLRKKSGDSRIVAPLRPHDRLRNKSSDYSAVKSSPAALEESSYEASNEASTTASVELSSEKS